MMMTMSHADGAGGTGSMPDGALSMQQKMLRQRQLALRRQSTTVGTPRCVVAQQLPSLAPSEIHKNIPGLDAVFSKLDLNSPSCSTVPSARDVENRPQPLPPAAQEQASNPQDDDALEDDSFEDLGSGDFRGLTPPQNPAQGVGQGWDLDIRPEELQNNAGGYRFWRPWKTPAAPVEEVTEVQPAMDLHMSLESPEALKSSSVLLSDEITEDDGRIACSDALNTRARVGISGSRTPPQNEDWTQDVLTEFGLQPNDDPLSRRAKTPWAPAGQEPLPPGALPELSEDSVVGFSVDQY
eukprot:TRINITY_DN10365_c1_g1_i1.p1 TRINITY_DN10365_c1_g1~~TRINITY_DN10365_c1_g1_i1.p1  ORF type:complete len:296 (-),score=64.64 TRINITY_DN10365_c1_g1_i1:198-1085(-)